jgi:hypothetical protein
MYTHIVQPKQVPVDLNAQTRNMLAVTRMGNTEFRDKSKVSTKNSQRSENARNLNRHEQARYQRRTKPVHLSVRPSMEDHQQY